MEYLDHWMKSMVRARLMEDCRTEKMPWGEKIPSSRPWSPTRRREAVARALEEKEPWAMMLKRRASRPPHLKRRKRGVNVVLEASKTTSMIVEVASTLLTMTAIVLIVALVVVSKPM